MVTLWEAETETEAWSQTWEALRTAREATRGQGSSSRRARESWEGSTDLLTPDFKLGSGIRERIHVWCFMPPSFWQICYNIPGKQTYPIMPKMRCLIKICKGEKGNKIIYKNMSIAEIWTVCFFNYPKLLGSVRYKVHWHLRGMAKTGQRKPDSGKTEEVKLQNAREMRSYLFCIPTTHNL